MWWSARLDGELGTPNLDPVVANLTACTEGTMVEETIVRRRIAPDVVVEAINDDGLVALYFRPPGQMPCFPQPWSSEDLAVDGCRHDCSTPSPLEASRTWPLRTSVLPDYLRDSPRCLLSTSQWRFDGWQRGQKSRAAPRCWARHVAGNSGSCSVRPSPRWVPSLHKSLPAL
jgi:hypothetical protein